MLKNWASWRYSSFIQAGFILLLLAMSGTDVQARQVLASSCRGILNGATSDAHLDLSTVSAWSHTYRSLMAKKTEYLKVHPESDGFDFAFGPEYYFMIDEYRAELQKLLPEITKKKPALLAWHKQILDYIQNVPRDVTYRNILVLANQTTTLIEHLDKRLFSIADYLTVPVSDMQKLLAENRFDFTPSVGRVEGRLILERLFTKNSPVLFLPTFNTLIEVDFLPGWGTPMFLMEVTRRRPENLPSALSLYHDILHGDVMFRNMSNDYMLRAQMGITSEQLILSDLLSTIDREPTEPRKELLLDILFHSAHETGLKLEHFIKIGVSAWDTKGLNQTENGSFLFNILDRREIPSGRDQINEMLIPLRQKYSFITEVPMRPTAQTMYPASP